MKTGAVSHDEQWTSISSLLELLRIQTEQLEVLAVKTTDWVEPAVQTAEDRRPGCPGGDVRAFPLGASQGFIKRAYADKSSKRRSG